MANEADTFGKPMRRREMQPACQGAMITGMAVPVLALVSMFSGGVVYVLWRTTSLEMFAWFDTVGISTLVVELREWTAPIRARLPDWVVFSLPHGLWLFSGCLAVHCIWRDVRCRQEQFWMAAIVILALAGETCQAIGVVDGVFEFRDVALILTGYLFAELAAWRWSSRRFL